MCSNPQGSQDRNETCLIVQLTRMPIKMGYATGSPTTAARRTVRTSRMGVQVSLASIVAFCSAVLEWGQVARHTGYGFVLGGCSSGPAELAGTRGKMHSRPRSRHQT